ncbi:MAG: hypothetical protein HY461_00905 [Parcubacteria group bacterium]|nr:hypothetical protein [Parcubacteria group bacterium]
MYSLSEIRRYVVQKMPAALLVDTNILVLLFVGLYNPALIKDCDTTNRYSKEDFELLKQILRCFKKCIITPHVVAELSNLSKKSFKGERLCHYVHVVVEQLKSFEEQHLDLSSLLGSDIQLICQLGFTDVGIYELSQRLNVPVITDDMPMCARFERSIPMINFQLLRNAELTANLYSK